MKVIVKQLFILVVTVFLISSCTSKSNIISVAETTVNYKKNATGVDKPVELGWKLTSDQNNQYQTAYQILIAKNEEDLDKNLGTIWDSKKIDSDRSVNVSVDEKNFKPGTQYFWKVKVWDKDGVESDWSATSSFITALYTEKSWSGAKWISYEEMEDDKILVPGIPTWGYNTKGVATRRAVIPLFRKDFITESEISSAFLFVSGLGHYKAYINGDQISDDFMTPGWTNYQKTCSYNTYDVTKEIIKGDNAIGIIVGTGFYNINNERYRKMLITYGMPKTIAKLVINYTDGTSATIVTDNDWKTAPSPVTYSSIYGGESYDARLEQEGWNKSKFDDSSWKPALLAKLPGGELKPEVIYPVQIKESYSPIEVIKKGLDTFAFDFGQNASSVIEIQLKGKAGDTVRIYPSEILYEKLRENQRWVGWPHYYEYILKGDGVETWSPKFTYYGMRYAHVLGAQPTDYKTDDAKPEIVSIKANHVTNSAPNVGSFWCSNPLFNKIDTLIRYAIESNLQTVMTDCPHRERLGWIEQTYLMGNSILFNYDIYHMYAKQVNDMMDSQRDNGLIGNIAPEFIVFGGDFTDSPEWGSASIQVPWLAYKWYGDISLIEESWQSMVRYLEYLDTRAENNIISYGLGDWYDLGPKEPGWSQLSPLAVTATSIYYLNYKKMAKMAGLLGKTDDEKAFSKKAGEIRQAYNDLFFDKDKAIYATGSQTAMAIPLSMGMVDEAYRDKVLTNLVDSIIANEKALTAGDVGFHYLMDALTEGNYSQLIYDMNNRDDVPGYGYQIKKGATALTESWEALDKKSNNHLMLGHIMEWFYEGLGGIRQTEGSVAHKNTIIEPAIVDGLEEVKTSLETPYGLIKSAWKNTKETLKMDVVIPVNTDAEIYITASENDQIKINGNKLEDISDIKVLNTTENYTQIKVGAGVYDIVVEKAN